MKKRAFLQSLTSAAMAALMAGAAPTAFAQAATPIKFQLDWRFEGPAALFLTPVAKGYFKQAGLDVVVDAGNGNVLSVEDERSRAIIVPPGAVVIPPPEPPIR